MPKMIGKINKRWFVLKYKGHYYASINSSNSSKRLLDGNNFIATRMCSTLDELISVIRRLSKVMCVLDDAIGMLDEVPSTEDYCYEDTQEVFDDWLERRFR